MDDLLVVISDYFHCILAIFNEWACVSHCLFFTKWYEFNTLPEGSNIYIYNFQCFLHVGSPDLCFQINYVSDASYLHHIYENTML